MNVVNLVLLHVEELGLLSINYMPNISRPEHLNHINLSYKALAIGL